MRRSRLRRPRFTVRRLMIIVLVAGILLGIGIEGERRRKKFRDMALTHSLGAAVARDRIAFPRGPATKPDARERMAEIARYHDRLREIYFRAARFPWFPVAPDPPEPPDPG